MSLSPLHSSRPPLHPPTLRSSSLRPPLAPIPPCRSSPTSLHHSQIDGQPQEVGQGSIARCRRRDLGVWNRGGSAELHFLGREGGERGTIAHLRKAGLLPLHLDSFRSAAACTTRGTLRGCRGGTLRNCLARGFLFLFCDNPLAQSLHSAPTMQEDSRISEGLRHRWADAQSNRTIGFEQVAVAVHFVYLPSRLPFDEETSFEGM